MSFGAPWFLAGGGLAALAVIALHFLIRQQPERWQLPTTRFVPETQELAPARSLALNDRRLLLLRVLAIAAAAFAFARPSFEAARPSLVHVIVEDRSSSVGDTAEVMRTVDSVGRDGNRILPMSDRSVSAALLRAIREAHALRDAADSVAIVLVSPLVQEQLDAATLAIRRTWPGAIAWKPAKSRTAMTPRPGEITIGFRGSMQDPLRASVSLLGFGISDAAPVRVVRVPGLAGADSVWARQGGVLVHWPELTSVRDTIGAVVTDRTVLVAGFARPVSPNTGMPVAWWADGEVAAVESALGSGCIRTVAVPVPAKGDLVLRERFRRVLEGLLVPCGGARDLRPADSAAVVAIVGDAPAAVATSTLPPLPEEGRAAMPWLLALALLLLAGEQLVRRRGAIR